MCLYISLTLVDILNFFIRQKGRVNRSYEIILLFTPVVYRI